MLGLRVDNCSTAQWRCVNCVRLKMPPQSHTVKCLPVNVRIYLSLPSCSVSLVNCRVLFADALLTDIQSTTRHIASYSQRFREDRDAYRTTPPPAPYTQFYVPPAHAALSSLPTNGMDHPNGTDLVCNSLKAVKASCHCYLVNHLCYLC